MKKIFQALAAAMLSVVVDASGQTISTIAGNITLGYSGDGGNSSLAVLNAPLSVITDATGSIYFADLNNHCVRKINLAGIITTIAGTGTAGYGGDGGPATLALLNYPAAIAVDIAGNIFIADKRNNRVRAVNAGTGIITTIAGTGVAGYSADSSVATAAQLDHPTGVAVDTSGNIYISDGYNHAIRKVATSGILLNVAGIGAVGYSGDGGLAIYARLDYPCGIAIDNRQNIYIADAYNYRIRKINAGTGKISSIFGTGIAGYSTDGGPATSARMSFTQYLTTDAAGNVYIAEKESNRVRKIDTSGIISTIAGTGVPGYYGDGASATDAELYYPNGVAFDLSGNMFIADYGNNRVRRVAANLAANDISKVSQINIFPNPVTEELTIANVPEQVNYKLINFGGVSVQHGLMQKGKNVLNMKNDAAGIYFLEIASENDQRHIIRLVKE